MLLPPFRFETERLAARLPRAEDAPAVFAAYAGDREVTKYLSWMKYSEVAPLEKYLREQDEVWKTGKGHFSWLLSLRGTEAPAGSIGFSILDGKALFGYVIAKELWGRGLASEALRWLVDWTLSQPELFRAWAFCDVENPASARVMEKAGMLREGLLRRWHVCPNIGPEPRDCLVYARSR